MAIEREKRWALVSFISTTSEKTLEACPEEVITFIKEELFLKVKTSFPLLFHAFTM
jgi:hypothetical protein